MYDISILIPAIRQNRWLNLYNSIEKACKTYSWQLVLVSPFDIIEELKDKTNIKLIKDYGNVTRAIQIGMLNLDSDLVFLTVDDCIISEDSIDICLKQYQDECFYNDVLCMRYKEGTDIQTAEYYIIGNHNDFRGLNINQNWISGGQFIMNKKYFIDLGGFDCRYEYMVYPAHDLMFRIQRLGGRVLISKVHACEATHYPGRSGDHGPVNDAQLFYDYPLFIENCNNSKIYIDYNNWKNSPSIWNRRFSKGITTSYESLIKQEEYNV